MKRQCLLSPELIQEIHTKTADAIIEICDRHAELEDQAGVELFTLPSILAGLCLTIMGVMAIDNRLETAPVQVKQLVSAAKVLLARLDVGWKDIPPEVKGGK